MWKKCGPSANGLSGHVLLKCMSIPNFAQHRKLYITIVQSKANAVYSRRILTTFIFAIHAYKEISIFIWEILLHANLQVFTITCNHGLRLQQTSQLKKSNFFLHWDIFSSEVKQCNLSVGCKNCRAQPPLRGPKGIRGVFLSITLHDHINIRRLKIKVPIRAKTARFCI